MNVRELLNRLNHMDPNAEVYVLTPPPDGPHRHFNVETVMPMNGAKDAPTLIVCR